MRRSLGLAAIGREAVESARGGGCRGGGAGGAVELGGIVQVGGPTFVPGTTNLPPRFTKRGIGSFQHSVNARAGLVRRASEPAVGKEQKPRAAR